MKQLSLEDASPRKQKSTDFYNPSSGKKNSLTEQRQYDRSDLEGCTENIFYCEKYSSNSCAEGAIGNLMNMLDCPENDMKQSWVIAQSPVHLIQQTLSESCVPKAVLKSCREINSIEKSLWIICKKIKFSTTSVFQIQCFQNLQEAIDILRIMKFPLIISVMVTHAYYHHVVVIWRRVIIEYESKYTFPLTNDSLRQICGVNTTFVGISCSYGIFPSNYIQNSIDNVSVEDWGINKYVIKGSSIRKYFK